MSPSGAKWKKRCASRRNFHAIFWKASPDLSSRLAWTGGIALSVRAAAICGRIPSEIRERGSTTAEQEQSAEFTALYHDVSTGAKKFRLLRIWGTATWTGKVVHVPQRQPLFDAEGKASGVIMSVRHITVKRGGTADHPGERLAAMGQMIGGFAHELILQHVMGVAGSSAGRRAIGRDEANSW